MDVIEELKEWLSNNSASYLATRLGYRTSATVVAWVTRGKIPAWQVKRVKKILAKGNVGNAT